VIPERCEARRLVHHKIIGARLQRWVKTGSALVEHKISASPPKPGFSRRNVAGMTFCGANVRFSPKTDLGIGAAQALDFFK
jgi:hypothetical protein